MEELAAFDRAACVLVRPSLGGSRPAAFAVCQVRLPAHARSRCRSDLDAFRQAQRIFHVHAQVADGIFDFRMAEQDLHSAQIT